jgi:hypothetical protein
MIKGEATAQRVFEKLTSILNKRSSAPQAQYDEHSLL